MTQYLITLWTAIKNGLLRIFPLPQKVFYIALALSALLLISCSTPRQVTQLVHDTRVDTVYMTNQQYDSICIYKDVYRDRSKDTVYLRDVSVEYRYKLLRDTVKVIQRDSIPYEVTVVETKEITRPLTWFDHLTRLIFWFIFGYIVSLMVFKLRNVFKP